MSTKTLPYFRWYPADADMDVAYSALSDTELGFFHRCLNKAWVNGGLPADLDELARTMHVRRAYLDRVWKRVGNLFSRDTTSNKLVNGRQEEERRHAIAKSLSNQRIGNANAKGTRSEKNANASQHARARAESESVSVSDSSLPRGSAEGESSESSGSRQPEVGDALGLAHEPPDNLGGKAGAQCGQSAWVGADSAGNHRTESRRITSGREALPASRAADLNGQTSQRFPEFWQRWPRKQHRDAACRLWISVVSVEDEAAVFGCLDRFLASEQAARAIIPNPENWLLEQSRDRWQGDWPARASPAAERKSRQQEQADAWREA